MFKNFLKKNFKTFIYFYKYLRHRIFLGMGLNIGVGILDGLGLAMFLPLLELASNSDAQASGNLGKLDFLLEGLERTGLELNLFTILLVMSTFFILKGVTQYISGVYNVKVKQYFIKTLRINLSVNMARMSYKAYMNSDAGRIQNTLTGEVSRVSRAYEEYFFAFEQTITALVYIGFAFVVNPQFALLICIGGGVTNFIFKRIYTATKLASQKITTGSNFFQSLIIQFVTNFKYLKATGYINNYNRQIIEKINYIERNEFRVGKLSSFVRALREPILILTITVVILIEVTLLNGALSTIMLSLLFFYRALTAFMFIQQSYNKFLGFSGSLENMKSFQKEIRKAREIQGKGQIHKFSREIELRNVNFSYGDHQVLKEINLKIIKNKIIAFAGKSGSGKSTLINIIAGLVPPTQGELLIDGKKGQEVSLASFQKKIGYITQEPVVFNDTVFNNISLWEEPTQVNLKKCYAAMLSASISEFVEALPEKENTIIGINGVNLSGGQKQRISIARELYKDVDILILDEATSSLDSETEKIIQRSLEKLKGAYTIIVVAHRLSTIKNADRIFILSNGKIVDEGTFSDLLVNSIKFKKMVELQAV